MHLFCCCNRRGNVPNLQEDLWGSMRILSVAFWISGSARLFDLAFATGIAALQGDDLLSRSLAKELLRHQNTDGSWAGGRELRVTEATCSCPWEDPRGKLYRDLKGLISTATCLLILSRL
jgi:hypothetical protein